MSPLGHLDDTEGYRPETESPGQLVDSVGYRRRARGLQTAGRPRGPSYPIPITRESWPTPRALGHEHESPRSAGRHRGHSDSIESHPGELVDPAGPRMEARFPGRAGRHRRTSDPGPSRPWALAQWPESPVTAARPRGKSDPGPSRQGELVDPAGYRSPARVAQKGWLTPRALGTGPESSRTAS